jgi:hypothetical protein
MLTFKPQSVMRIRKMKYLCPRCGSGEHLAMLYSRRYREGDRSGAFAPLVVKGLRLAHCTHCASIVPATRAGKAPTGKKKG